jgi:hypothetical protein
MKLRLSEETVPVEEVIHFKSDAPYVTLFMGPNGPEISGWKHT